MKKLLWIFSSTLLLSTLFLSTGCGDDPIVNELPPFVEITAGPTSGAFTVSQKGEVVSITVNATKGTNPLKTLTILEDGTKISDLARLEFTGQAGAANPFLLTGANADGITGWVIKIKVQDAYDKRTYTVRVEDDKALTDSEDFDVTVLEPIEKTITGATIQLWNAGGPAGKGGIDLDDGTTTGSADVKAEIRDMGIDSTAGSGDNWRKQIGPTASTEIKFVGNALPDFNFNTISTKRQIEDSFGTATAFTATLPTWGSFKVSAKILVGDIFVVKRNSTPVRYYLVKVDKVTETTVLGDNTDNYQVSIKY